VQALVVPVALQLLQKGGVPAFTRNTGGDVLPQERRWPWGLLLLLLPLLPLLLFQLFQQGSLLLLCLPSDDSFDLSGLGDPPPRIVGLAVGLQEGWSLVHRVLAGIVWFQALLALN